MPAEQTSWLVDTLLSPQVLVTFILCAALAGVLFWLQSRWQRRQRNQNLDVQRRRQEATIERLLDSVAEDKESIIEEYEERIREKDHRIAALEREASRLRDRLSSTGMLGLFGGRQKDAVGALLLENEQLHELLAEKQAQMRDLMADMTGKLMDRFDEQARESAHSVRYKQVLLSAFLQHQETRRLLDSMIAEGKVSQTTSLPPEATEKDTES